MFSKPSVTAAALLLIFTLGPEARAETPQSLRDPLTVEEPTHITVGPAVTVGSTAGFAQFRGEEVSALGAHAALTLRFGILSVEAQFENVFLRDQARPGETPFTGTMQRVGLSARLDLLRLRRFGKNTLLILYGEGGAGRQRANWVSGHRFTRSDITAGFGWVLDHRLNRPGRALSRIGWFFGWRFAVAPPSDMGPRYLASCQLRSSCPMSTSTAPDYDLGMFLNSGLILTW